MNGVRTGLMALGGLLASSLISAQTLPGDLIFGRLAGDFEIHAGAPANDFEAARFLTQASFGPIQSEFSELKSIGYSAWIEQQGLLPASLQRPSLEQEVAASVLVEPRPAGFHRALRIERWFRTAVQAPDQLRQRMAHALSQMLVVSDVGALDNNPIGVAEYHDVLLRHAFGNYRELLHEVTLNPAMAIYLTSLRNLKTDWTADGMGGLVPSLITPDENYAREVMQLFSIGLIERNLDYSPLLVNGETVPTYDQDTVTNTAKVFTGHAFQCTGSAQIGGVALPRNCGTCVGAACQFTTQLFFANPPRYAANGIVTALIHPDAYSPLVCYPRYADTGRAANAASGYVVLPPPHDVKTLVSGVTIPASPVACHASTPANERQQCIDYCNAQIDDAIDALFLHPNTAPFVARQLIQRFTTSNPTPAYIERVASAFEDDGNGQRGNLAAVLSAVLLDEEARSLDPAPEFGKLREPMLRLVAIWRAFGAQAAANGQFGVVAPERAFAQRPLGAASVFNFYDADYQPPGPIADAGLVAPELQILNESTAISASDELWRRIFAGYNTVNPASTPFNLPSNGAHLPPAQIDALPLAHDELVDALNLRMLHGGMSSATRARLIELLDGPMASADPRRKALSLIHLISILPEFALQR